MKQVPKLNIVSDMIWDLNRQKILCIEMDISIVFYSFLPKSSYINLIEFVNLLVRRIPI